MSSETGFKVYNIATETVIFEKAVQTINIGRGYRGEDLLVVYTESEAGSGIDVYCINSLSGEIYYRNFSDRIESISTGDNYSMTQGDESII